MRICVNREYCKESHDSGIQIANLEWFEKHVSFHKAHLEYAKYKEEISAYQLFLLCKEHNIYFVDYYHGFDKANTVFFRYYLSFDEFLDKYMNIDSKDFMLKYNLFTLLECLNEYRTELRD